MPTLTTLSLVALLLCIVLFTMVMHCAHVALKIKNISGMYDGGYKDGLKAGQVLGEPERHQIYENGKRIGRDIGYCEAMQHVNDQLRRTGKSLQTFMGGL